MSAHDWPNDLGYRPPERIDLGLLNDDNLADEWRHLRGFGLGASDQTLTAALAARRQLDRHS